MSKEFLPFTSLNAAAVTGAGAVRDLEGVYRQHTVIVVAVGMTNQVTVKLEGSHDNINWYELGNSLTPSGGGTVVVTSSVTTHLVRYIRANLTNITGTVTAVTATIATGGE